MFSIKLNSNKITSLSFRKTQNMNLVVNSPKKLLSLGKIVFKRQNCSCMFYNSVYDSSRRAIGGPFRKGYTSMDVICVYRSINQF